MPKSSDPVKQMLLAKLPKPSADKIIVKPKGPVKK